MAANESQRLHWNDDEWVAVWPKRERMTDEVTPFLIDALALRPGERVLDIGCGGGKLTIAAAHIVAPAGSAVGADISVGLTALAASRAAAAHVGNATFVVADAQTDPIAGAPFDVVTSQFGVMFFDETVSAFTNIRAQMKPGGRIVFACWQPVERNPWFLGTALAGIVPPLPPPAPGKNEIGPFSLGDPDRTRGILEAAGFTAVGFTAHEISPEVPPDALTDDAQLARMGVPNVEYAAARAIVTEHLEQFLAGPGLAKFPLAFHIFRATAG